MPKDATQKLSGKLDALIAATGVVVPPTPAGASSNSDIWDKIEERAKATPLPPPAIPATPPAYEPEPKAKPKPSPTPEGKLDEAGTLLNEIRERNTPMTWEIVQRLAKDLDDNVLRAVGLREKDEPNLFGLAHELEVFVAAHMMLSSGKPRPSNFLFGQKDLPIIPKLEAALDKSVTDLIERSKGKDVPVHAQADDVTFTAPAPKRPKPIEVVDLTGQDKSDLIGPYEPTIDAQGRKDAAASMFASIFGRLPEQAGGRPQAPQIGTTSPDLDLTGAMTSDSDDDDPIQRQLTPKPKSRSATPDYGKLTPAYEHDMFDPDDYGTQDWQYRSRSRSEFEQGFPGRAREPAHALGLHTGHKAGPRVAAARDDAGAHLDLQASFDNIWKNILKFAIKKPKVSTKMFNKAGFKFLPTSSGVLKGQNVGLLSHLNLPYAFRGRRYGSGATGGPLFQMYNELVTGAAANRHPPTFESLLEYTRSNVADRTEAFFTTKSQAKGLGSLSRLTEEQRDAIRQLLDPVHGFNNELMSEEGRWLEKVTARAPHRYQNTLRKSMKNIISKVGTKEDRKFISEYPKQGATSADHNRLHRICVRLTKHYGRLFAHLDKSTSDETVEDGSRAERGLAKFEEWEHYKTQGCTRSRSASRT